MTWRELAELAAGSIKSELPTLPEPRARRVANRMVEDIKIELLKMKWTGQMGDNDRAFFGSFERAKG